MPKSSSGEEFIIDGILALDGGMNAGILPQLLKKNQVAFATNCTFRGGFATHRPPFMRQFIDYGGNAVLQSRVETGIWQGAEFFKSEYGEFGHVVSLSGRIFFFVETATGFSVRDVTPITGGVDDPNTATGGITWMWQSERWMIINDGIHLPIFFDGNTSRRSRGSAQLLGTTNANFTVPAIGSTVVISLAAPYTGPFNETIMIGTAFYQVTGAGAGYQITLENVGDPYLFGGSAGDYVLIRSDFRGLSASNATYFAGHLTFSFTGPIVAGPTYLFGDGGTVFFQFNANGGPGPYTILASGGSSSLQGSPAFAVGGGGSNVVGKLINTFVAPPLGGSVNVVLDTQYIGALGQLVQINNSVYKITAVAPVPPPSTNITVLNIGSVAGATVNSGAILQTVPELPAGKMGAYGMGRNAECLVDGRSFIIGDIVGGPSGSPSLQNRDSVLKVTENAYLAGGGVFVIPGNTGDIRSMTFTANLDQSLGQGPLQVGTPITIFSVNVPVDRTTWNKLENPILTESLKGKGPLGQYSTNLVNSDTIFRANDGIGSLILARRDFDVWGNVPISREVQPIINLDNKTLLINATSVDEDNRLLMSSLPTNSPQGVYHQGTIALNFDGISNLQGKSPTIYDGFWTGLNVFEFLTGQFSQSQRSFAFALNTQANRLELWELLPTDDLNNFDNGVQPITWSFETAALFTALKNKGSFDLIELLDGEIYIASLVGAAQIQVWYRAENDPCWHNWISFGICARADQPLQYRTRLGLGQPDAKECDQVNNRPARLGTNFQVRFQITGSLRFMGAEFKAMPSPETEFSAPICEPLCDLVGDIGPCEPCKINPLCQKFPLVFYNMSAGKTYSNPFLTFEVVCPNGQTVQSVVQPGTVNFTLPFPPGFEGEYPPLVLSCAVGGYIVRTIPPGSTQDQIDVIVNEMIMECAQAIAQQNAPCPGIVFPSDAVFYPVACPPGQILTYNGTLPSWITIDTVNSRLIGAAGTFTGTSVLDATATAQSALNAFGDAAVLAGTLFCQSPISIGCICSYATIATGAVAPQHLVVSTGATQRAMALGFDGVNGSRYFINTSTNTLITTVTAPAILPQNPAFASSNETFWCFKADGIGNDSLDKYDKDGNFLANVIVSPGNNLGKDISYEPITGKIYCSPFDGVQSTVFMVDPSTNAVTSQTVGAAGSSGPNTVLASPGFIYVTGISPDFDPSTFHIFSVPAFAPIGVVDLSAGGWPGGFCYAPNTGKVYFGAYNNFTFNTEIWEVNPATGLIDFVYDLSATALSRVSSMVYDPVEGSIIAVDTSNNGVVINPSNRTIFCAVGGIAGPNGYSDLGVDPVTGIIYQENSNLGTAITLWHDCDICVDGLGNMLNNRYGVVGYVDGLFPNSGSTPTGNPAWDGSFNAWFSTAFQGWASGEINTLSVQGNEWCIALLYLDCMGGGTPNWFLSINDGGKDWVGTKVGGQTPEGQYDRISGLDATPASVVIALLPGTTVPLAGATSCAT